MSFLMKQSARTLESDDIDRHLSLSLEMYSGVKQLNDLPS